MLGYLLGLAILALDVWALMHVFRSSADTGVKIAWLLGIVVFPVLGFIAWYVAGPKDTRALPPR